MTLKSGVYFILPGHEDTTAALKRVLSQIGGCSLRSLKVDANDAETIQDAQGIARGQVESGLSALLAQMAEWTADARNNRPRSDAVSGVLSDFQELKVAAELYQDALEIGLQDLTDQIDTASAEARLLLGTDDEWKPSPRLVRIYSSFTEDEETYPIVDGVRRVPAADLEESGLSKSAFTHATYYSRTNSGGKALGSLGFRGTLTKGFLVIRPLADTPATVQAVDVAATVTPEAEQEGPATKLNNKSDDDLKTAYSTVLGEEPGALTRDAMIEAILAA